MVLFRHEGLADKADLNATKQAARELGERVVGYFLECPYRDLRTAVRNRTRKHLPPVLDWIAYRGLVLTSPWVLAHADEISPIEAIRAIPQSVPVFILAGGEDLHALPEEAADLAAATATQARLEVFENAGHEELLAKDPERYTELLREFLQVAESTQASR